MCNRIAEEFVQPAKCDCHGFNRGAESYLSASRWRIQTLPFVQSLIDRQIRRQYACCIVEQRFSGRGSRPPEGAGGTGLKNHDSWTQNFVYFFRLVSFLFAFFSFELLGNKIRKQVNMFCFWAPKNVPINQRKKILFGWNGHNLLQPSKCVNKVLNVFANYFFIAVQIMSTGKMFSQSRTCYAVVLRKCLREPFQAPGGCTRHKILGLFVFRYRP